MRVLVTGANGFIGSHLVRRLVARDERVRCLVHRSSNRLADLPVELVQGSITDRSALAEACAGCELIFHLAGRATDWGTRRQFFEVNTDGTANLIAAAQAAGARRLVFVSSLAVHRFGGHRDADEDTPADQTRYAYGASKAAAERLVRSAEGSSRLQTVILRPGVVVFGPEDTTAFVHMAPFLQKGRWTHVAGGRSLLCYSYVDNLIDGILLAGDRPEAAGGTFNLTDDLRLTWRSFIGRVIAAFGRPERTLSVPAPLARLAGMGLEAVWRLARAASPPPITDYRTALVARDFHFSCERAKQVLDYRPRVSLEQGLRATVQWYRRLQETR